MNHRGYTCLVLSIAVIFLSVSASATEFDYRPFLHLEGRLLAKHLMAEICTEPKVFETHDYNHITPFESGAKGFFVRDPSSDSGHREKIDLLKNWILSQKDGSIKPLELTKKAISIQGASVLEGLRLVYDTLARYRGDRISFVKSPLFAKLIDITGEQQMAREAFAFNADKKPKNSVLTRISSRGGKASSWYHFFGAASVAFDEGTKSPPVSLSVDIEAANACLMGQMVGKTLLRMERFADNFLHLIALQYYVDTKKRHLTGVEGVEFGAHLAGLIVKNKNEKNCLNLTRPPDPYLTDRSDIYGADYPLRLDQYPTDR